MKNKKLKRPSSKNKIITLVAVVTLLAGGIYFIFFKKDPIVVNQEEQQIAAQADVDAAKERVNEEAESEPLKDIEEESTPNTSAVALSNLTFSQSSGMVKVSASVAGIETGSCSFIFTDSDGRAISKQAKIASGGCSISTSEAEFTMIGDYNLTIRLGDKSLSKTINIK